MGALNITIPTVGQAFATEAAEASAVLDAVEKALAFQAHRFATGGAGTSGSPWTSPSGTGGIEEAVTAAIAAGRNAVYLRGDHFAMTSAVNNIPSGFKILTEGAATVLATTGLAFNVPILDVQGTSGAYLTDVDIGGFRIKRASGSGGHLNLRYVRKSRVGHIFCDGGDGWMIAVRDTDGITFAGFQGVVPGASSGIVKLSVSSYLTVGPMNLEGGEEGLDVFDVSYSTFADIVVREPGAEGVDIGSCSYCLFGKIIVIESTSGAVVLKAEDTYTQGCVGTQIEEVIVLEHQAGFGLIVTSFAADYPMDDIKIGKLTIKSTAAAATGADIHSYSGTRAPIRRFVLGEATIIVPKAGLTAYHTEDLDIEGYFETTTASGTDRDGPVSCIIAVRPKVRAKLKSKCSHATNGAFTGTQITDFDLDLNVLSSDSHAVALIQFKRGRVKTYGGEAQRDGVYLRVYDDGVYEGNMHTTVCGSMRNVGKNGAGTHYCGKLVNDAGTPVVQYLHFDNFEMFDDQGVATSKGIDWGTGITRDHNTIRSSTFSNMVTNVTGAKGTNDIWTGNSPSSVA